MNNFQTFLGSISAKTCLKIDWIRGDWGGLDPAFIDYFGG